VVPIKVMVDHGWVTLQGELGRQHGQADRQRPFLAEARCRPRCRLVGAGSSLGGQRASRHL